MRFRQLLIAVLVLGWSTVAQADYDTGYDAYQRGDYRTAVREWEAAARQGDANAPYALGYLYENGEGVRQDYVEAARWYQQGADAGNIDAVVGMGYLYEHGLGVKQNFRRAVEYYTLAADALDPYGLYYLAGMYAGGRGVPADIVHAYTLYGLVAGSSDADEETKRYAIEERSRLRQSMSAAQIQQADAAAASLLGDSSTHQPADTSSSPYHKSSFADRAYAESPPATDYPQGEDVRWVQQALAALGYDPGPADGSLGPQTQSAIRAFQSDMGLPADGTIDANLFDALDRVLQQYAALPDEGLKRESVVDETPPRSEPDATGTGMLLNDRGQVLTNYHVIEGCRTLSVTLPGAVPASAAPIATDEENDLAVVRISGPIEAERYAAFRDGRSVRLADEVIAVGYPLTGLLSSQVKVTTGSVSALAGLYDDTRHMQISVPVQPGNSGGPLVDLSGNVVGVITSKLDAVAVAEATGDIPQNINFAIKSLVARSFLDANSIDYELAPSDTPMSAADAADLARQFTVFIACFE